MILGLILSYYVGRYGYVSKTQVHYAVKDESLPLFIVENLYLIVLPISTLFAYCLDDTFFKKRSKHTLCFFGSEQIIFRYSFFLYVCIVIAKIFQLSYFGEWIITCNGTLLYNVPCSLKDAVFLVINTTMIGRHFFWLLDSLAVSYLVSRDICYMCK